MTDYTDAPAIAPEVSTVAPEASTQAAQESAPPHQLKPGSIRAQISRQRRKDGMRCVTIEIRDEEISALIKRGLLASVARSDKEAIKLAIYSHLDKTLV